MLRTASFALTLGFVAFAGLACSSSSGGSADSGMSDGGGTPDMGMAPDSGVHPDAEPVDTGMCDPIDGTGCSGAQGCVWVVNTDAVQCRDLGAAHALETACSATLNDCAQGLTCTQLNGEAGPTCHKVCDPQGGGAGGCTGLMGMSTTYSCAGLMNKTYGVCVGGGMACTPYMDMCAANETCSLRGRVTTCEPSGTTARGGDCTNMNCVKGSICVNLQGTPNPTCYEPCNPQMPNCMTMNDVCLGLGGLGFGICRTPMSSCDPLNDMCPANEVCSFNAPNVECGPLGTTPVGGNCMTEPCARGGICVLLQGQPNPKCYEPCNLMTPMCSMGQCGNIGLSFGICN